MVELTLRNDLAEIPRLLDAVESYVEGLEPPPENAPRLTQRLGLCLDEAATNIISYAWPEGGDHAFTVRLTWDGAVATTRISDDGAPFDPLAKGDPEHLLDSIDDRPIGGLGVHLIRQLSESVAYEHRDGHNHLTFVLKG